MTGIDSSGSDQRRRASRTLVHYARRPLKMSMVAYNAVIQCCRLRFFLTDERAERESVSPVSMEFPPGRRLLPGVPSGRALARHEAAVSLHAPASHGSLQGAVAGLH